MQAEYEARSATTANNLQLLKNQMSRLGITVGNALLPALNNLVGALMGFLWYNAYPAQLIMGDLGSLALGATLALVAVMTGQWLLLPVIGLVFAAETLSVMLTPDFSNFA